MNTPSHPFWRLLGLLAGLTGLSFFSAVLIAAVLAPLVLIGGGCGLYLGLHAGGN